MTPNNYKNVSKVIRGRGLNKKKKNKRTDEGKVVNEGIGSRRWKFFCHSEN